MWINELANLPSGSEIEIDLWGVDRIFMADAVAGFHQAFRALRQGGRLTFTVQDFGTAVERYRLERMTSHALWLLVHVPDRMALWDEATLAYHLLQVGFYKVWTGAAHAHGELQYPEGTLLVEALKFTPSHPVASIDHSQ